MITTIERYDVIISEDLQALDPLLQRVYSARQITQSSELNRDLRSLLPYNSLKNIAAAANCVADAIMKQKRIIIVGDFDVDGATSTAVAMESLRLFGAQYFSYKVPNRFEFGYGLSPEIVDSIKDEKPDLIITVDNGISSIAGVAHARSLGIEVLVTDHHIAGDEIPKDCIIVNPNQPGDDFLSKSAAGVGVIFYVMLAVREALKNHNWFDTAKINFPNMGQLLDLVALGTVADVVPLDKNNRILVYQGLQRIRAGLTRPGIIALAEVAKRSIERLEAVDFGFALAPRLNAAGRLEDMTVGIECLLSQNQTIARQMAQQLDQLNHERKTIETTMKEQAFAIVDKLQFDKTLSYGLSLYDKSWHQGVVGLVASRVKDQYHRPVIAFAKVDNHTLKGSARSINGVNIRDVLADVDVQYPDLIIGFGGHAMAAGLSIHLERYADFSQAFNAAVTARVSQSMLKSVLLSDGELAPDQLSLVVAQTIKEAGPWGQAFPEPIFDGEFYLVEQRVVGGHHLKMVLRHPELTHTIHAIAFFIDLDQWPNYDCEKIKIAYKVDINYYKDRKSLQLMVEYLEEVR